MFISAVSAFLRALLEERRRIGLFSSCTGVSKRNKVWMRSTNLHDISLSLFMPHLSSRSRELVRDRICLGHQEEASLRRIELWYIVKKTHVLFKCMHKKEHHLSTTPSAKLLPLPSIENITPRLYTQVVSSYEIQLFTKCWTCHSLVHRMSIRNLLRTSGTFQSWVIVQMNDNLAR